MIPPPIIATGDKPLAPPSKVPAPPNFSSPNPPNAPSPPASKALPVDAPDALASKKLPIPATTGIKKYCFNPVCLFSLPTPPIVFKKKASPLDKKRS